MIGIFCRANHPDGYGQCGGPYKGGGWMQEHTPGTAHGYVTLIVRAHDREQLDEATAILRDKGYYWPERNGDGWYDGRMDLVLILGTAINAVVVFNEFGNVILPYHRSLGDNRAVAFLEAHQLIARAVAEEWEDGWVIESRKYKLAQATEEERKDEEATAWLQSRGYKVVLLTDD